MVAVAAILLRRERADARRFTALALASGGLVLVLANAKAGTLDPVGAALAMARRHGLHHLHPHEPGHRRPDVADAAVRARLHRRRASRSRSARRWWATCTPARSPRAGWGWLLGLAVVSTVAAVSLFFAGLRRVGPTSAAILSTAEPVVTVILAFLVFGELLGPLQLLGGGLVIVAVLVLASHRPRDVVEAVPA